jgi:hypothetical protein
MNDNPHPRASGQTAVAEQSGTISVGDIIQLRAQLGSCRINTEDNNATIHILDAIILKFVQSLQVTEGPSQ